MNKTQIRIFRTFENNSITLHKPYYWRENLIDVLLLTSTYTETLYL